VVLLPEIMPTGSFVFVLYNVNTISMGDIDDGDGTGTEIGRDLGTGTGANGAGIGTGTGTVSGCGLGTGADGTGTGSITGTDCGTGRGTGTGSGTVATGAIGPVGGNGTTMFDRTPVPCANLIGRVVKRCVDSKPILMLLRHADVAGTSL
jgi:hypothetical protein